MEKLKLNIKNTILVGLAFASISAFWETYQYVIPRMLDRTYGLTDSVRGLVMGLDNILALFLLPLFGRLSDRTNTRFGKRTPYFFFGTIMAVILFVFLPMVENKQLSQVREISDEITNVELWDYTKDLEKNNLLKKRVEARAFSTDGKEQAEIDLYVKEEFIKISKTNDNGETNQEYNDFVRPALQNYILKEVTAKNPLSLIMFLVVLLFLLFAMATYRSPAVALMPDVTPEPLRSPANAIINLMGGIGTVAIMGLRTVLFAATASGFYDNYYSIVLVTDGLMLVFFLIFMFTVRENKLLAERERICLKFGIEEGIDAKASKTKVRLRDLPWSRMKYFLLALLAIGFCTMGTDVINSTFSVYAINDLGFDDGKASLVKMIAMVFSALAFVPVGYMAYKFGRKKTIMLGFILIAISLLFGFFITYENRSWIIVSYFLMNFGSVIATVNTLPLVLEKSDSNTVGTFTGLYYVATMLAAAISPYLGGLFMERFTRRIMYLYGTACLILAIIALFMVKGIGEKKKIKANVEEQS